jgi:hypothetical protein
LTIVKRAKIPVSFTKIIRKISYNSAMQRTDNFFCRKVHEVKMYNKDTGLERIENIKN